jgi:Holliday junction resolvasome RuvABC endonuclease subunit
MSNTPFLQLLRGSTDVERECSVRAFDPDTGTTGWAILTISMRSGQWFPRTLATGSIAHKKRSTGAARVQHMIDAIDQYAHDYPEAPDYDIVEGQEFYSGSEVDANDLIHLAQVAGALRLVCCGPSGKAISMPTPREWKGTKRKEGMHVRAQRRLGALIKPGTDSHTMDAVCMCLWKADLISTAHAATIQKAV